MLGRWHATARLPLIICCTLQFSMHKASIEVKGTSVHLEFFHKALSFIVVRLLFLGDHAVTGVASAACTRRRSVCKTIVSTNVSSRSCCKLTNSLFCQLFHRASGFLDKLLEAFAPLLFERERHSAVVLAFRMGPAVLGALSSELSMELRSQSSLSSAFRYHGPESVALKTMDWTSPTS